MRKLLQKKTKKVVDKSFLVSYDVTQEAVEINRTRIALRLSELKARKEKK